MSSASAVSPLRVSAPPKLSMSPGVQRFAPGDKIRCPPFGDGVVRESRIEKGREILIVDFPMVEDMRIDTTTRHVRLLDDNAEIVDDELPL
ncbi:hypothetical protein HC891_00150 [Candidatus Gracilibacteria bacterium]|nr:hypothetical protein [Candidatus Gracilibacteria bacterium]